MIHYLWKHKQVDASFAFIPENTLPSIGFCSVYGVSDADAKALLEAGTYAGFKGVVYPGTYLWIDVDDNDVAQDYVKKLEGMGLEFQVWATGNRGLHFAIRRDVSPSPHVPNIDKAWVQANFPNSDLRLYSHLHLLRREGTIHEKTGLKKRLLSHTPGAVLFLEYSPAAAKAKPYNHGNIISVFESRAILDLSIAHEAGSRRKYMLRLAAELARTNNPIEFSLMWMVNVNMLGDPLDFEDLERIVQWAYDEVGR